MTVSVVVDGESTGVRVDEDGSAEVHHTLHSVQVHTDDPDEPDSLSPRFDALDGATLVATHSAFGGLVAGSVSVIDAVVVHGEVTHGPEGPFERYDARVVGTGQVRVEPASPSPDAVELTLTGSSEMVVADQPDLTSVTRTEIRASFSPLV